MFGTAVQKGDIVQLSVIAGSAVVYGTTTDDRTNDPAIQFAR